MAEPSHEGGAMARRFEARIMICRLLRMLPDHMYGTLICWCEYQPRRCHSIHLKKEGRIKRLQIHPDPSSNILSGMDMVYSEIAVAIPLFPHAFLSTLNTWQLIRERTTLDQKPLASFCFYVPSTFNIAIRCGFHKTIDVLLSLGLFVDDNVSLPHFELQDSVSLCRQLVRVES